MKQAFFPVGTLGRRFELLRCEHQWFSRPPPWAGLGYPSKHISVVKSLIKGVFIWLSIQLKITVKILPQNISKEIDMESGLKMYDLLKKINLKPDNIIILRGNTPVPVDDILTDEQELTIIQVASGG